MSIPSQLPQQLALAIRQGALQALALQAGQVIEAKILGTTPNGVTQVQIGQQTINVSLPSAMPVGMLLSLLAQGSGPQQKLVLVQPQTAEAARAGATVQTPSAQSPPVLPGVTASAPAATAPAPQPAATVQAEVVPVSRDALQPLALQSGQRVEGRVLGTAADGATQLQIGRQTITVVLPAPLPAGTVLPLQVEGDGASQKLTIPQPPAQPAAAPAPAPPQPGAPPAAQSARPQAALAQMAQGAVQRQNSIAPLTMALATVLGKVALPQPVAQAGQQVLAASLPLGPVVDSVALQKAIATSGIFQEALLAQGAPELAKGDLKTNLLTLQKTLVSWLGQAASGAAVPAGQLPPPVRGALPRAKAAGAGPIALPDTPIEAGKVLVDRTESALARLRLHQHASLPEQASPSAKADWSMDLPVVIGGYQTVMQLQIHRDESGPSTSAAERGWQIRFAMDLPKLGEVGAQVGLRGGATSVRLWATDLKTAQNFEQAAPELAQSLAAAGLRPGIIIVRAGEPSPNPPASGHFVDTLK